MAPSEQQSETSIIWSGEVGGRTADRVTLVGGERDGRFVAASASYPAVEDAVPSLPLAVMGANLLPGMQVRAFGIEERAHARLSDGVMTVWCTAGRAPAGVVIRSEVTRLPRFMNGAVRIKGEVNGRWLAAMIQPGADAEDPRRLRFDGGTASFPLDASTGDEAIVLLCPQEAGEISLRGLSIHPDSRDAIGVGTWQWHDAPWREDPIGFARGAERAGLSDVALLARIADGRVGQMDELRGLEKQLRTKGIGLRFVEGDPSMATPEGLPGAVARTQALRAASKEFGHGLGTLELDIEPHAMRGYAADPAGNWKRWAAAVRALSEAWGAPVLVDVPWWMLGAPGGEAAMESVADVIDGVVVMAYRTEADAVLAISEPWLAWGARTDRKIQIAIESGPVATELHRSYREADTGELLVAADGTATLHARPLRAGGDARAYRYSHETRVAPTRVSFCGDDARRRAVQEKLLPVLSGWSSFTGFRVHGVLPVPGLEECR